ncbi:MAG: nitrophenyl compound nitroreductase subunit ArsF family protein [Planctomycetota bacterium]
MKSAVTVILLIFVAASVAYLVVSEARPKTATTDPATRGADRSQPVASASLQAIAKPANEKQSPVLVAYYFHGTFRCPTCLKMEKYAREAVEETFDGDVQSGRVQWQAVNYDEPANEHFVKQYKLVASALVLVSGRADAQRWQKLERTWDLVGDEPAFKAYVIDQVTSMLRGDS